MIEMTAQQRKPKEVTLLHLVGVGVSLLVIIFTSWVNLQVKISGMSQAQDDTRADVKEIKESLKEQNQNQQMILQKLGAIEARMDMQEKHDK